MKRPREHEIVESRDSNLPSLELAAHDTPSSHRYEIKDLVEDIVISEIFPKIGVVSQLCLAVTSKVNYGRFLHLILQHPSQGNRNYLQRWIQHLASEGHLLDRLHQARLKLYNLTTDTPVLTAIVLICQFILSDRRDQVLFNKVLLLAYDAKTRVEVIRFLIPYFMNKEERVVYKNTILGEAQVRCNPTDELVPLAIWLDECDQTKIVDRLKEIEAGWGYPTSFIIPPFLMSWKDKMFDEYYESYRLLNDNEIEFENLDHHVIPLMYTINDIRQYLNLAQAELFYKSLQRLTHLCYLKWQQIISEGNDDSDAYEIKDFMKEIFPGIASMNDYLRRRFDVAATFELEYSILKSNPQFLEIVNPDVVYTFSYDCKEALHLLVKLCDQKVDHLPNDDHYNMYMKITKSLSANLTLKSEMDRVIDCLKNQFLIVKSQYGKSGYLPPLAKVMNMFGEVNVTSVALYNVVQKTNLDKDTLLCVSAYLQKMPNTDVENMLKNFYEKILYSSKSDDKNERLVAGFCLLKLGRLNSEEIHRFVVGLIEFMDQDAIFKLESGRGFLFLSKLLKKSTTTLVKDSRINMAHIEVMVSKLQNLIGRTNGLRFVSLNNGDNTRLHTHYDNANKLFRLGLVNICFHAPIRASKKHEILIENMRSDYVLVREKIFLYLLQSATPDTVRYILDHCKTEPLIELMKQRLLLSNDEPDEELNNALRI